MVSIFAASDEPASVKNHQMKFILLYYRVISLLNNYKQKAASFPPFLHGKL